MARRPFEVTAPTDRRPTSRAPALQHPSLGRVHRRDRVPADVGRRRAVRQQLRSVADDEFRPDVEGLRAVAVVAVVLFHLRLGAFRGGYVGVDVFFVLSGFLITRLLLKELASTGTLSLSGFWARRARRLLPASILVLTATVLAGAVMLSPLAQRTLGVDAMASGAFVVNFVFANRLGDYFAEQLAAAHPSPLLHYWSLAVEEQFYLLWPLVLFALTRRPRRYRRLVVATIVTLGAMSLVAAVWLTDNRPTWAFYLLPARMVELLAGAALAAAGPAFGVVPPKFRAALGWFGLLGITVAVMTYDTSTAFPGTAAMLPVLSTVLVIVAGGAGRARVGSRDRCCATRSRCGSAGTPTPSTCGTGRCWSWPRRSTGRSRCPCACSSSLWRSAWRRLRCASSRIPCVTRRGWPSAPLVGSHSAPTLCATAVLVGAWARTSDAPLDSGEIAAAPTLAPQPTTAPQPTALRSRASRRPPERRLPRWPRSARAASGTSTRSSRRTERSWSRASPRRTCRRTCGRPCAR